MFLETSRHDAPFNQAVEFREHVFFALNITYRVRYIRNIVNIHFRDKNKIN